MSTSGRGYPFEFRCIPLDTEPYTIKSESDEMRGLGALGKTGHEHKLTYFEPRGGKGAALQPAPTMTRNDLCGRNGIAVILENQISVEPNLLRATITISANGITFFEVRDRQVGIRKSNHK